jgi:hypothetical protein
MVGHFLINIEGGVGRRTSVGIAFRSRPVLSATSESGS